MDHHHRRDRRELKARHADILCAEKYGTEKWAEYRAGVKYRIFPGVY